MAVKFTSETDNLAEPGWLVDWSAGSAGPRALILGVTCYYKCGEKTGLTFEALACAKYTGNDPCMISKLRSVFGNGAVEGCTIEGATKMVGFSWETRAVYERRPQVSEGSLWVAGRALPGAVRRRSGLHNRWHRQAYKREDVY